MTKTQDRMLADLQQANAALQKQLAERNAELAARDADNRALVDRQEASVEVLRTISASPDDPQPAFELIARRARELCNAAQASVTEYDGAMLHMRARDGYDSITAKLGDPNWPQAPNPDTVHGRVVLSGEIVHIRDLDSEGAKEGSHHVMMRRRLGSKSLLGVPLLREGRVVGAIAFGRAEIGGFDTAEIALVESFAEQAVIAITSAANIRALRERTGDLQESLEYQTATSDMLNVISRSTFDLQPVLTMVAETAARLCAADQAALIRHENGIIEMVANSRFPLEFEARLKKVGPHRLVVDTPMVAHRAITERRVVHIHDVAAVPGYAFEPIKLGQQRTSLGVPLMRAGEPIGSILLARRRVEPFTNRQISLVENFAAQAVIAIENTNLLTEQQESLEHQTATAEVLQVINTPPGNLTPVFDAVLEKAIRLCDSAFGMLATYDGHIMHYVAMRGLTPEQEALLADRPLAAGQPTGRIGDGENVVHLSDARDQDGYRAGFGPTRYFVDQVGARTAMWVALRKDKELLGLLTIFRREVRAFADKEISLVQNFAAQAVIAMENARLITEQRDALEQQTATAEVLQVINASPGDLTPVFEAMLERAMRLCGGTIGGIFTFDGDHSVTSAVRGVTAAFAEYNDKYPMDKIQPGTLPSRIIETRGSVQYADMTASEPYRAGRPYARALVELGGIRATLAVPLLKDGVAVGMVAIYRQQVGAFSDKQIALLQNFAAQAVIAMENARLITEQREALEQQTATAEVLQVINASPGNLTPVFDAILEKAHSLCGAARGALVTFDGEHFRAVATRGLSEAYATLLREPQNNPPGSPPEKLLGGATLVHVADFAALALPIPQAAVELEGARTVLFIPLRRDSELLGYITAYRQEVRPFTDKQIVLLQNFAAQAVIAMENARLLQELRTRTDELAQRQSELRITFENMGDGVAMFDESQCLVAWNRKFQDILDVPDAAIAERRTFDEYIRYLTERGEFGRDADPNEQVRRLHATRGQAAVFERTRPNGRIIEVRQNPVPGGGFVLIYADITERKRSEAEIRTARDAAESAYRDLKAAQANLIQAEKMASLGQLTAGIAHEIKNPLNFVNNFAALSVDLLSELKETAAPGFAALTDDQRADIDDVSATLTSNLEKITEHGKRADGIVKAMLEHSRGSSAERRMVDLNALIDEALNLAYHGARAQDQSFNITLERDFAQAIAPIEVNPQDLTRVLLNIFSNGFYAATRRARNGGDAEFVPMLKITTRDAGDVVEIRVRDNGIGIPAEIRDKLFQPFFTTKPTGEGTGLGLSITYDIVTKQHGGTIAVDSEVDAFTEFVITLPRQMFGNGGSRA